MEFIIVQNHNEAIVDVLSSQLPDSVTLLPANDSELPGLLDQHEKHVKAVVLFTLSGSVVRFCDLIRNGRFCHPWTPIAIIDNEPNEAGPVGSEYFATVEDASLIDYLSKPVSKSILVIEDDDKIRTYLSMCLGSHYSVETASNADAGERLYKANKYDLLIMDVMLPGRNGDELTKTIRETDLTTPILIVTAYDTSSREADFNKLGATDYMSKPFTGNDVVRSRVMSILSAAHQRAFKATGSATPLSADDAWRLYNSRVSKFITD